MKRITHARFKELTEKYSVGRVTKVQGGGPSISQAYFSPSEHLTLIVKYSQGGTEINFFGPLRIGSQRLTPDEARAWGRAFADAAQLAEEAIND